MRVQAIAVALLALVSAGCEIDTVPGARVGDLTQSRVCRALFPAQPLATLATQPTCCGVGEVGHCFQQGQIIDREVASVLPAHFDTCPSGGLCVPDSMLINGATAQYCTTNTGQDGACFSPCLPSVRQNIAQLTQGTCAFSQLCVPCNDPRFSRGLCQLRDLSCGATRR